MASYAPFIEDIKIYKGTTFSYQFNFEENESPLDLTVLSDIEVRFSKPGKDVFKHTVSDGDLTISGTDDNHLIGEADAETMDIGKREYDLTVRFFFAGGEENVYVDFNAQIVEGENQTAHEWNFNIDTDAETTSGEQLTGLAASAANSEAQAKQYAANLNRAGISSGEKFFIEHINKTEGEWENSYSGISVAEWHDGDNGSDKIQSAIDYVVNKFGGGSVLISNNGPDNGIWNVSSTIEIPDNITLVLRRAYIKLDDGVDDNIIRNADQVNGNTGISIIGDHNSVIDGNASNQNRSDKDPKWIGLNFLRGSNYYLDGFTIKNTAAYGGHYFHITDSAVGTLEIDQDGSVANQDGFDLLVCENIQIGKIYGTSEDDLCAISNGGGDAFADYEPQGDVKKITIGTLKNDGHNTFRIVPVGGYQFEDISVDTIIGEDSNTNAFDILTGYGTNPAPAKGEVKDINIGTIIGRSSTAAFNWSGSGVVENLNIDKIFHTNPAGSVTGAAVQTDSGTELHRSEIGIVQAVNVFSALNIQGKTINTDIGTIKHTNGNQIRLFNDVTDLTIGRIIFRRDDGTPASENYIDLRNGTIDNLNIKELSVHDHGGSCIGIDNVTVSKIKIADVDFNCDAEIFLKTSGTTVGVDKIYIDNIDAERSPTASGTTPVFRFTIPISDLKIGRVVLTQYYAFIYSANGDDVFGEIGDIVDDNLSGGWWYGPASGGIKFTGITPPTDSALPHVLGSKLLASPSWDPDGDGNGEYVMSDGTAWQEIVDLPNYT